MFFVLVPLFFHLVTYLYGISVVIVVFVFGGVGVGVRVAGLFFLGVFTIARQSSAVVETAPYTCRDDVHRLRSPALTNDDPRTSVLCINDIGAC